MKIRKIIIYCLVVCSTTLFLGCEGNADIAKRLTTDWQCTSYSWKYFDNEMASFKSHLNASSDSNTKAVYNDSIKILNIFEEKAKSAILEFYSDGSSLIILPSGTIVDSLKGKWSF